MFKPPYWFHDNVKFSDEDINILKKNFFFDDKNHPDTFLFVNFFTMYPP